MKKRRGRLKRNVTWLAALVVALLVAGYAIVASLDLGQVAQVARDEVKARTGRDLVIAGPVDLEISLTPAIALQDLRFANAEWGSRAEMATVRRLEIEVDLLPLLTGQVVVRRLVAIEPDILLETGPDGRGNWEFETATAPSTEESGTAVTLPDIQDFRIEGGRLRYLDTAAGEDIGLEVVEATGAVPSGGGAREIHLEAAYNGNPFTVDGTYAGLAALLSAAPGPVDLTVDAAGATATLKGTAGGLAGALRADLAVTLNGEDLSKFSPWAGSELPALGPYSLSGNMKADGQVFDFSGLVAKIGGSDLTGNLALSLAGERPAVKAALVSKTLDLDDFTGSGEAAGSGGDGGRVFPDDPLPLAALRAVDGEVTLNVEKLHAGNHLLEGVETELALKNGALVVAPFAATLAGGRLDGRLALDAGKPQPALALRLDGKGLDFGELLKQAEISEEVGGALDLEVDVTGEGASPRALAAELGGHVQAVSLEGTVDNALLRFLSVGLGDITGPLFGTAERTRLECLVTRFDIEGGEAESRALVFDTGAFAVAGRGGIDLREERVNLAFDTETSEPSLASLAVPFHVTGPLTDPVVSPDPVGAAVGVVGTAGDVAKTGANIVGGAVDSVGGLIGTGPIIGQIGSDQTLCGEALAAIGQGSAGGEAGGGGASPSRGVLDDVGDAVKDAGEGIERGIRNLFGN